jgi:hypothetical protein
VNEESLPCPHGRASWKFCPHCLGLNDGDQVICHSDEGTISYIPAPSPQRRRKPRTNWLKQSLRR